MNSKILVFLIILFFTSFLYSQVNFELDFSFSKIVPDDELTNLQLFDYNNDGNDELFAGYDGDDYLRIVCYDENGDSLFTHCQEKEQNQVFEKFHIYIDEDGAYLITASILWDSTIYPFQDSILINIYDFENYSLIDSCIYSKSISEDMWLLIGDINSIKVNRFNSELMILIGYRYIEGAVGGYEYYSDILKFQLNENSISFIETIPRCGEDIYFDDQLIYYFSTGFYGLYNELGMHGNQYRYLKLISADSISTVNTISQIYGSWFFDEISGEIYYSEWPNQFMMLTENKDYSLPYGNILYYKTYSNWPSSESTDLKFKCFSPDFSIILWDKDNTQTGTSDIISSTNVRVNNENHYVLYFRENQLEIRDIITGNIVHSDSSAISPFTIKKTSGDKLLFFESIGDDYYVYSLSDEIWVGTDDNLSPTNYDYKLSNYPNPFNQETTISYSLPHQTENIKLCVYNIKGQKIKTLINERQEKGNRKKVMWNGRDSNNLAVSSGLYFVILKSDDKIIQTKKITLIK